MNSFDLEAGTSRKCAEAVEVAFAHPARCPLPVRPCHAGLRQVRGHDLRRGATSLMLAAGDPMTIVSKMLRHSSIGITVDTYGHLSEDTARTASDGMAAALEQAFEATAAGQAHHRARRGRRPPR